jgi:AsmA protein
MAETSSENKSKGFPLWAKIGIAVVAVLIVIALAVPYFLDVDRYRDSLASALQKQTGRPVTLGKIKASVFPAIAVVVQDLHVGNPAGFPAGDVISAEEIRGSLAIGPLLQRKIHVNSFELVHPKLTLLSNPDGSNNYTFASSSATPPAAAPATSDSGMSLDQIDTINLTNAEVYLGSVVRGAAALVADTKGISVAVHNFALTPMRMKDWQAESKLSGVTLALGGWSQPIVFHSGQFTVSGGKMDAQFVADLAKASDIKGTLSVPDFEHPQANFEISASELDIDKLIAAAGSGPAISSGPTPKPAATPVKGPSELIAHGHINIEKISTKPYTVGPANVEIRVFTDRAELWPISIGMYGGTLQISSRVDRVTDPARFTANVQMRNLDVAKVLEVSPSARGKMGGTGELDLPQLAGNLSGDWKKTLSGAGKFAVRNGHLPGVNLSSAAESVAKLAGVGGDTSFTVLEGDFNIADQKVTSKQIHLDSPSGIVDLRGDVTLNGALDYQGQVTLNPAGALGNKGVGAVVGGIIGSRVGKITVPFALAGTIDSPKVTPGKGVPSFGAPTSATGTAAPATSPLTQPINPQNAVDTLKGLFGKKH